MSTRLTPWLRWTCIAALVLGLAGLGGAYWLTLHIQAIGLTHPDPAHGIVYGIEDYWYVTRPLGLTRNLLMLVSFLVTAVSAAVLFRRELWYYLWTRYLEEK
jgi:hypothetical protein